MYLCVIIFIFSISGIVFYILFKGFNTLSLSLFFGDVRAIDALTMKKTVIDGIYPALIGSFLLVFLTLIIAVPLGIFTGIYLSEYVKRKTFLNVIFDILASIPSIIIGLFGLSMVIIINKYFHGNIYPCLFISSLSLVFLILPYIIRATQISLESIPFNIRIILVTMGASKIQNIFYVLLPYSIHGIISGVLLSCARVISDVAVIMLTGSVIFYGIPKSVFEPFESIAYYVFFLSAEYRTEDELLKVFGASFVLLVLCLILFAASEFLGKTAKKLFMIR
ncbi:PstA family ABC transporter permease [Thermodesulfovibrio hydrogeniphilus]